jgi:hypothetical protein
MIRRVAIGNLDFSSSKRTYKRNGEQFDFEFDT